MTDPKRPKPTPARARSLARFIVRGRDLKITPPPKGSGKQPEK